MVSDLSGHSGSHFWNFGLKGSVGLELYVLVEYPLLRIDSFVSIEEGGCVATFRPERTQHFSANKTTYFGKIKILIFLDFPDFPDFPD